LLVLIAFSPLIARLLAMAVSRQREYLADATAAQYTRNPRGLAEALEKIRDSGMPFQKATRGTAHLFFANPLRRRIDDRQGKLADLLSSHPPIERRIVLLYQMAGIRWFSAQNQSSKAQQLKHFRKSEKPLLSCPQCDREMTEVVVRGNPGSLIQLDQCQKCGGIWCDKWELFPVDFSEADRLEPMDEKRLREAVKLPAKSSTARVAPTNYTCSPIQFSQKIFNSRAAALRRKSGSIVANSSLQRFPATHTRGQDGQDSVLRQLPKS
jgi:Zn-finger nucleic acid-binding protein